MEKDYVITHCVFIAAQKNTAASGMENPLKISMRTQQKNLA